MEYHKPHIVRRSYAIPEEIQQLFEYEAKEQDLNTNAFLVKMMKKWLYFDLPLSKIGALTIPEPCHRSWVDMTESDKLEEMALRQASKNFSSIISLFNGTEQFDSLIESYYDSFGRYSGWYIFKHKITRRGRHRLELHHKHGIKWSRYLASYNRPILERVSSILDCRIEEMVVTFEVVPNEKDEIPYNEFALLKKNKSS